MLSTNWSFLGDGSLERLGEFTLVRLGGWTGNGNIERGNLSAGRNKKLLERIIYLSNKFYHLTFTYV
jgi:hypothetical protein